MAGGMRRLIAPRVQDSHRNLSSCPYLSNYVLSLDHSDSHLEAFQRPVFNSFYLFAQSYRRKESSLKQGACSWNYEDLQLTRTTNE